MIKIRLNGPGGIWLDIDHHDAATPALVCCRRGREVLTSTYDCAMGTGFIEDTVELTSTMVKWLDKQSDLVEEAYTIARKDAPEYN